MLGGALALTTGLALSAWQCGGQPTAPAITPAMPAASTGVATSESKGQTAKSAYDPLALATASRGRVVNREAGIPPQCYTRTNGTSNPCWTCHSESRFPNLMSDWRLQKEYSFSEQALTNHWRNLFVKPADLTLFSDEAVLAYVRQDNYTALRHVLQDREGYTGYRPDLNFAAGFDDEGFARDDSGWRAFRYKPFPGAFWPTNGSTDDVMIRLPTKFRQRAGSLDVQVYKANLAVLEASFASDPEIAAENVEWDVEPINETKLAADLDRDGKQTVTTHLRGLPSHYFGDAAESKVHRSLYPQGTEFLHSVRYIDPDVPSHIAVRMKELRYLRKDYEIERWKVISNYEREQNEREEGKPPVVQGEPLSGLVNDFGWRLQGFIEDAEGKLRLQTHEEQMFCTGCHTNLGVTLDQTFAFPRKVPGRAGWAYQDLRGIPDVPQLKHKAPEILTYFRRVKGGDEFRSNGEMLKRFFPNGKLAEAQVARLGAQGIEKLLMPSRARALQLNKAYWALVKAQTFERGRDVVLGPATNVHESITNGSTGLGEHGRVFTDGQLRLDWK